jgi:hypothetical protein
MMPKYRQLSLDELGHLEKDFVDFLVVNGVTADDWKEIQKEAPEKRDEILDAFSDVVFESILRKIEFLDFRSANHLMSFQCLSEKMVLVGIKSDKTDLTNWGAHSGDSEEIEIYSQEKSYSTSREDELFAMMEKGCEKSDGKLFKAMCLAL